MVEKYIVVFDTICKIAVKYNVLSLTCTIGGQIRYRKLIRNFINDYFTKRKLKIKIMGETRIKYKFKLIENTFTRGLIEMDKMGISYGRVKTLGRMIR